MTDLRIYMIIDGSGSMGGVKNDVVDGVNEFIKEQKQEKIDTGDDIKFTLTVFDSNVGEVFIEEDIDLVNDVTVKDTFLGGSTALLDAIGKTLVRAENEDGKKLVVIYTDGNENASREYTKDQIRKLIEDYQATGKWQIIYMSAELEDFNQPRTMGISGGNTIVGATRGTTKGQFTNVSKGASYYRTGMENSSSTFYADTVAAAATQDWGEATGGKTGEDIKPADVVDPATIKPKSKKRKVNADRS